MAKNLISLEVQQKEGRDYVRAALDVLGVKPSRLAELIDASPSTINRFMNKKVKHKLDIATVYEVSRVSGLSVPGSLLAAYGLTAAGAAPEAPEPSSVRPAPLVEIGDTSRRPEDVPVRGVVRAGGGAGFELNLGETVEHVGRPLSLPRGVEIYALYVEGDSMAPRYEPGETILVYETKPAQAGRDVVVQMRPRVEGDNPRAYLKRLLKRDDRVLVLQQFNPRKTITLKATEIIAVQPVLTRDEMV